MPLSEDQKDSGSSLHLRPVLDLKSIILHPLSHQAHTVSVPQPLAGGRIRSHCQLPPCPVSMPVQPCPMALVCVATALSPSS